MDALKKSLLKVTDALESVVNVAGQKDPVKAEQLREKLQKLKKRIAATETLCLFLLALLVVVPASAATNATNFTMAELGFSGPQTILMYCGSSYIGSYNTTSENIPVPNCDFELVIKPEIKNSEPGQLVSSGLAWMTDNWVPIIFGLGIIIMATRKW